MLFNNLRLKFAVALVSASAVVGCGDAPAPTLAPGLPDAAETLDAGSPDSGETESDAGTSDAPDETDVDAGSPDSGETESDAGTPDAPDETDAGTETSDAGEAENDTEAEVNVDAGEPEPEPNPGICDNLPVVAGRPVTECDPGERVKALCLGTGLTGYRECNSGGTGWSRAHCDSGGTGINQEANVLLVTRPVTRCAAGFWPLVGSVSALGYSVVSVDVEDFMAAFPAATIQESIRDGLAHVKLVEMPNLAHVLLVGKPGVGRTENSPWFWSDVEVPLWILAAPPGTSNLDWPTEDIVPSTAPYKHPSWWPSDFGGRFRTTEWAKAEFHVGVLSVDGSTTCDEDGSNCRSDLQIYADKLAAWDPGDTFVESQFDGGACAGQKWPITDDNGVHAGVSKVVKVHSCQDGEGGDMGPLATADGADFLFYAWHGGADGSSDPNGYTYNASTEFGGIVMGHSCTTGAPDILETSLGEAQTMSPKGAIVYVGYPRVLASGLTNPMSRAFTAGRWTVGEAIDGMIYDQTGDLVDHRHAVKDMSGLMIYGFTGLPLVKSLPVKFVRTLASRPNADGTVDVCVEVNAGAANAEAKLVVGETDVASLVTDGNGWAALPVTVPSEASASGNVLSLSDCDPEEETCRVAGLAPEIAVTLQCGEITDTADGSLSVEVASSNGVTGQLSYEASAVYFDCLDGLRSSCYLDGWPWARHDRVVASVPTAKVHAEGNQVPFNLDALADGGSQEPGENEIFRAIRIELKNAAGNPIGRCYVPMDGFLAENLDLL
jgi:hypothetical protein